MAKIYNNRKISSEEFNLQSLELESILLMVLSVTGLVLLLLIHNYSHKYVDLV